MCTAHVSNNKEQKKCWRHEHTQRASKERERASERESVEHHRFCYSIDKQNAWLMIRRCDCVEQCECEETSGKSEALKTQQMRLFGGNFHSHHEKSNAISFPVSRSARSLLAFVRFVTKMVRFDILLASIRQKDRWLSLFGVCVVRKRASDWAQCSHTLLMHYDHNRCNKQNNGTSKSFLLCLCARAHRSTFYIFVHRIAFNIIYPS